MLIATVKSPEHEGNELRRWEGSELGRLERWEGSEVTKWERWEYGEVASWEMWKGGKVGKVGREVRWQGGKGRAERQGGTDRGERGEVARWERWGREVR